MAENKLEDKKSRIDLLYKNLEHVSHAYSQAEGVFPLWESAFALIIGQLLIVYFNPEFINQKFTEFDEQRFWICLVGTSMSFTWFMLVSLNLQNSLHIGDRMQYLQLKLANELRGKDTFSPIEFVDPWPCKKQKENWSAWNILVGKRQDETTINALWNARKSTWFYRRLIPLMLFWFWIFSPIFIT
jgi:hypothetical protein